MNFKTADALLALCDSYEINITEVMMRRESELFGSQRKDITAQMSRSLDIMEAAVKRAHSESLKSMGGLVGGEAKLLEKYTKSHATACGSITSRAMRYALGVMEVNASMGLIVAAPTAGSSGVIPGVVLGLGHHYELPRDVMLDALFCSGAVGYLIMLNATVSGAEGGCQAEVGSASAMAAAAAVQMLGGTPAQSMSAASTAIVNLLGLVCDPVCGLVEVPCQKRNAVGAANALTSAEMALAGLRCHIPLDEAISAMYTVGRQLPGELRETAMGGIAITPAARKLCTGSC